MKYLLTSSGVKNDSLRATLVEMLGKPIAEASALCIPTAILSANRLCGLGWKGLGLVDFALLPHVDHADHPESSMAKVERMAAELPVLTHAMDDETAIKVVDGALEVVSEGRWSHRMFWDGP